MAPVIELENVSKAYGAHAALGPIDLEIPEGSTGLLGPNGAGKSTLIRVVLGLLPTTTGTVRVLGEEVRPGRAGVHRRIGYVPEGDVLFPGLNGVEAVAYAGELAGMRRVDALKRAHEMLDYVQLGEERYRLAERYSTGMRQRLKLAQALVHAPRLLILDEPTEGVDPEARMHLLDLVGELTREHGIHILLSTHILADVERLATHAVVLDQGRVAVRGAIGELRQARSDAHLVRVDGDARVLMDRLQERGVACEAQAPFVRVHLAEAAAVLREVAAAGLAVRHLAPDTLSLEDAFAQAVGGASRG